MRGAPGFAIALVAGAAVCLLGVLLGAWWVPFPVGIAIGVVVPGARWALPAGAAAGLVAWAFPLVASQQQYGLRPSATSLAAIMGFNGAAEIPVVLTCLVGLLLGLTGAWLGSAARSLYSRWSSSVSKKPDQKVLAPDPVPAKR